MQTSSMPKRAQNRDIVVREIRLVVDDLDLVRPLGIDQQAWTAIFGYRDRLGKAN